MSINRRVALPADHFTIIPNDWLRDERLSWKARGLLAYLMSHRVGWETSLERLASEGPDGRDAVRSGLTELTEAGYLAVRRARNADGTLAGTDFDLVDPREIPTSGNPTQADPTQVRPTQADPTPKKTTFLEDQLREDHSTNTTARDVAPAGPSFDEFWAVYPRKAGKADARKAWAKVDVMERGDVVDGARTYRDDPNRDPQFTAHPATWLRAGRWEDDPLPARGPVQPSKEQQLHANVRAAVESDVRWAMEQTSQAQIVRPRW